MVFFLLAILWAGSLIAVGGFTDPGLLKSPLMLVGMIGLTLLFLKRIQPSPILFIFLVYWIYGYFQITQTGIFQAEAVMQVGILFAFLLGYLRAPIAHRHYIPPLILLCVVRGLLDIVTLKHIGVGLANLSPMSNLAPQYPVTSFFLDKNIFGGILILGAFHHFYLMEKGEFHKPVQVFLYTSSLLVLLSILLIDSRMVMGVFFLCFLPLLFLSLKLDGKEPRLERLAWITGITLSLGIVWINLPEIQLHKMAAILSNSSHGMLAFGWRAAWRTFLDSPIWGTGIGGFQYSVVPFEGIWPAQNIDALPFLTHANNHFLETLAEGGLVYFGIELILLGIALFAFARVYFTSWSLEAKYSFFSLMALLVLSLFCPILESVPARFILWALVGYGWSLFAENHSWLSRFTFTTVSPRFPHFLRKLAGGSLLALACMHLWMRLPELRSDWHYAKALTFADSNPKAYTDHIVESLRLFPENEAASYAYIGVLTHFRQEGEAVHFVKKLQEIAPNARKRDDVLARVYISLDKFDSASKYASLVLESTPRYLPALEILVESFKNQNRCESLDSLRALSYAWNDAFPLPAPNDYTIHSMDSLFRSNQEVVFLQRWFGGKALRQKFVEGRLESYNQKLQSHNRIRTLQETQCQKMEREKGDSEAPPPPDRHLFRGWG
jgi:O-antigen ligase